MLLGEDNAREGTELEELENLEELGGLGLLLEDLDEEEGNADGNNEDIFNLKKRKLVKQGPAGRQSQVGKQGQIGQQTSHFGRSEDHLRREVLLRKEDLLRLCENRKGVETLLNGAKHSSLMKKGLTDGVSVSEVLKNGIQRIWEQDSEYQEELLTIYMRSVRDVPESLLKADVATLRSLGAFVIPNEEYMPIVFGNGIKRFEFGVYKDEVNRYGNRLMLPLQFLDGSLRGFVGYAPTNAENEIKYLYPDKEVLKKSQILFCTKEQYLKAVRDGYICLTDGLFDAIRLNTYGINAASLCGSAITKFHKLALSKIRRKIVVPDNDLAGTSLLRKARVLGDVRAIRQSATKDIDDYLKDEKRLKEFLSRFEMWKRVGFVGDLDLSRERKGAW